MEDERYLQIYLFPSELNYNLKENISLKLKQKYLNKEIDGKMITAIQVINFNIIPLSRTTSNNIEINILAKVFYKLYKPGDIFIGGIIDNTFVISNDIICKISNIDNVQAKNVRVILTDIKSTSGCQYFLAHGILI